MTAPTSLVSSRTACPLCSSNARREIDLLIHARHFASPDEPATDIVIEQTGEMVAVDAPGDTYGDTFEQVKRLLAKLPSHNTREFDLTDVIIHATNHKVVGAFRMPELKSEGKFLFADSQVYQFPDLKDYLRLVIAESARQIMTGEVKIPPKMGVEASLALWRMSGDSGGNEMVEAMIDMVKSKPVSADSPLGKAYAERQAKLAQTESVETAPPSEPVADAET